MLRKIIFSIAMLFSVGALSAQINFQDLTLAKAEKIAKEEDKLIFLDMHASWCPPCRQMEQTVFVREDVGNFMNARFVSVKFNIDEAHGKELAAKYNVRSVPTYLIFDTKGKLLLRFQGSRDAEDFMQYINSMVIME